MNPTETAAAVDAWLDRLLSTDQDARTCVLWPWSVDTPGYPRIWRNGGPFRRVSHVVLEGTGRLRPEPPGDNALHSCDTPRCLNPLHLRWGTRAQNNYDRSSRARDPNAGRALTVDDVRALRYRFQADPAWHGATAAAEYGVSRNTIHKIVTRRTWKEVA